VNTSLRSELQRLLLLAIALGAGCSSQQTPNIVPVYDKLNGKLQLLKYDSKGNGKVDTWSYMDGSRVLRIEIDKDGDGKIDRWEYYDADQKLEKIGMSRANDGKEDAWSYTGPDGAVARIDVSTRRDGKITRTEHYEKGALVRAEEDTDEDGRPDKWETYDDGRLTSVGFDTLHRGTADRRLIYGADGSARLEVDAKGDGHFVAPKDQVARTAAR
jgi:antitoxin component YwqK of YwqJK toxin-antitoxin module